MEKDGTVNNNHLEKKLEPDNDDDGDDDTTTVGEANDIGDNDDDDDETSSEAEETSPVAEKGSAATLEPSEDTTGEDLDIESSTRSSVTASTETPKPPKAKAMRIKLKLPKVNARKSSPDNLQLENAKPQEEKMLPLAKKPRISFHSGKARKMGATAPLGPSSSEHASQGSHEKSKSRIRSLKLPLSQKSSIAGRTVHATVVNSEDEGDGTAVATVVSSSNASMVPGSSKVIGGKRRLGPVRVRIPPLLSPGLKMLTPQSSRQQESYSNPAEIFEQAMTSAGYTKEGRTERPHRGSSVDREVGDMFDSDVRLSLHFPPLVPPEIWDKSEKETQKEANGEAEVKPCGHRRLVTALRAAKSKVESKHNGAYHNRKRPRPLSCRDMLPVTLTIPYPESHVEERLEYVHKVHERERAIVRKQEAEEDNTDTTEDVPKIEIPPIPQKPSPPSMFDEPAFMENHDSTNHPLIFPKAHPAFVSHLDKSCFHLTEGRYFGLMSNNIADPNFVGPNAPGIAGVTSAGGAGLATCTGGSGSASATLTLTSSFHNSSLPSVVTSELVTASEPMGSEPVASKKPTTEKKTEKKASSEEPEKQSSPAPTASASALRKVMEEGGSSASALRRRIIRAAVHASRTGNHGQPFSAGDKVYPDIGKAFAAHAGIKPCPRCKNNKQGAYHCRLRRRHFDSDFDGGDSMGELKPLFDLPLNELLSDGECS